MSSQLPLDKQWEIIRSNPISRAQALELLKELLSLYKILIQKRLNNGNLEDVLISSLTFLIHPSVTVEE